MLWQTLAGTGGAAPPGGLVGAAFCVPVGLRSLVDLSHQARGPAPETGL